MEFIERPLQYAVYKGKTGKAGALQFDLMPFEPSKAAGIEDKKQGDKARRGAVFITGGKAIAPDDYDWDNKIVFAMSADDLGKFLTGSAGLGNEGDELVNLYHKHGDSSKKLVVKQGNIGRDGNPTFMMTLTKDKEYVTVPLALSEMFVIRQLFTSAMPAILGW
jgi:hypothetical protein